jgi:hypothetical protein
MASRDARFTVAIFSVENCAEISAATASNRLVDFAAALLLAAATWPTKPFQISNFQSEIAFVLRMIRALQLFSVVSVVQFCLSAPNPIRRNRPRRATFADFARHSYNGTLRMLSASHRYRFRHPRTGACAA